MTTLTLKEADIGINPAGKNELAQKLISSYSEQQAIVNQINAAQWNSQSTRAAELAQLLSAAAPEATSQPTQNQARQNQTIQPFPPSYKIAERISLLGRRVPSDYKELSEYSRVEDPQSQETYQNAENIAKACETFTQTARQTIKLAKQLDDTVTEQVLNAQLQTAEQLATQLRRFK